MEGNEFVSIYVILTGFNIFLLLPPLYMVGMFVCLGVWGLCVVWVWVESRSIMYVCDRLEETGLDCRKKYHTLEKTSSREGWLRCSTIFVSWRSMIFLGNCMNHKVYFKSINSSYICYVVRSNLIHTFFSFYIETSSAIHHTKNSWSKERSCWCCFGANPISLKKERSCCCCCSSPHFLRKWNCYSKLPLQVCMDDSSSLFSISLAMINL